MSNIFSVGAAPSTLIGHAIILCLQATLVLGVIKLTTHLLRYHSADIQYRVWQLGFVLLLCLPCVNLGIVYSGIPPVISWQPNLGVNPSRQGTFSRHEDSIAKGMDTAAAIRESTPSLSDSGDAMELSDSEPHGRSFESPESNSFNAESVVSSGSLGRDGPRMPTSSSSALPNTSGSAADSNVLSPIDQDLTPASKSTMRQVIQSQASLIGWCLVVVWLVGFLFGLIRIVVSMVSAHRLAHAGEPIAAGRLHKCLKERRWRLGMRRQLAISVVRQPISPSLTGFVRPMLIIPEELKDWSCERLQPIFDHELAHLQRHDLAWRLLARVVCAMFWFHPWLRQGYRTFTLLQERGCDDRVVTAGGLSPTHYAELLLTLTQHFQTSPIGLSIAVAQPKAIEQRIASILGTERTRQMTHRKTIQMLLATATIAIICIAFVQAFSPRGMQVASAQDSVKAEVNAEKQASDEREKLRYEGKSFYEWMTIFQQELEQESKKHALKAITTFGKNGYLDEALAGIKATLHQETDARYNSVAAIRELGGADALIELLEFPNEKIRDAAVREIEQYGAPVPAAMSALIEIIESEPKDVSDLQAVRALVAATPVSRQSEIEPVLMNLFNERHVGMKARIANLLNGFASLTPEAVAQLATFLEQYYEWKARSYLEWELGKYKFARNDLYTIHSDIALALAATGTIETKRILDQAEDKLEEERAKLEAWEYERLREGLVKALLICRDKLEDDVQD